MSFKAIPKEIRDQTLLRVKEGVPVRQLSQEHGVSTKTIHAWLSQLSEKHPSRLAYGRVKRERDDLMKLVGKLSLELSRGKKINLVNTMVKKHPSLSKTALAKRLGVSRSSLYYRHKRPAIDREVKAQIESVLSSHPSYGHKRIALQPKLNKKRILRVMKKFGIKPYKRRLKRPFKKHDQGKPANQYYNLIKYFCPIAPGVVWVADFTYIRYQERFIYLATIMDLYTREIVGFSISRFHNQELVLGALEQALTHYPPPLYFHSDQGSEYESQAHIHRAETEGMLISMSHKASPWENGHKESFYSQFKLELGNTNRFESLGELIEEICRLINYYNIERIHTALKIPPAKFSQLCRLRV